MVRSCVVRALSALILVALAGCYASHTLADGADAEAPRLGDFPEGIVFDHPEGRFREVILTDAPLACDAVEYTALDATGSVSASLPRWISLVLWRGGAPSYLYHEPGAGIGPGPAMITIADRFGPGLVAVGDRIDVAWSADVVTRRRFTGPSAPRYCGVFSLR